MEILLQHFGSPEQVTTDRGSAFFKSKEFRQFIDKEGIKYQPITTGVPRANGQVERINDLVNVTFTKLVAGDADGGKWYRRTSQVQRAINFSHSRAIGTSPYKLLFGIEPRIPGVLETKQIIEQELLEEYLGQRDMQREAAKERIERMQLENRRAYDRKRKEPTAHQVGDLVSILRTQGGGGLKIKFKFLGPYIITKCNQNERYEVRKVNRGVEGPRETTTAADTMRPWRGFRTDVEEDLGNDGEVNENEGGRLMEVDEDGSDEPMEP